jgi:hypothetical protein
VESQLPRWDIVNANRDRLRAVEAASYLRVSRSTLAKWRMRGEGPPYHHYYHLVGSIAGTNKAATIGATGGNDTEAQ